MTSSFLQDQKQWLTEYSANDLSRTLVREYLYQHNMFKTLNCFETEDKENTKKIVKSTVIKMLCINNLVVNNKSLEKEKQCKSLLVLLTQYLRGKFEERILREQRSDCSSQTNKLNNREFSMNGDKILPQANNLANTIKEKNLVTAGKRQENVTQKTLTQQAFYKKKDTIKHEPTLTKKTSNNVTTQEKKSTQNHRPSTAKPTLNQKKEEKKEDKNVKAIYSKVNVKEEKKIEDDDIMAVEVKGLENINRVMDKQQPRSKQQSGRNTNSAIGRKSNNLVSQTTQSTQLPTKSQSMQNDQPQKNDKKYSIQEIKLKNNNKWNTEVSQSSKRQTELYSEKKVEKVNEKIQAKQQAVTDEYFDQFEEEIKPQTKQVKKEVKIIEDVKEQKKEVIQKHQEKVQSPKVQEKVNTQVEQPKVPEFKAPQPTIQHKPQIESTKPATQVQSSYQPTTVSRGGMKLLKRTTKPLSKQQDATEMIGGNIKLLPDDIKPQSQDLFGEKVSGEVKEKEKKLDEFKIQTKKESLVEEIKSVKKQESKQPMTSQTNVRQIKLKKKLKPAQEQPIQSTKFKFDENFVDEPLNGVKQKYTYQKFSFQKMTIKPQLKPKNSNMFFDTKINYTQKPTAQGSNPYSQKKKNEKPLSTQKAQEIKKIMFQKGSPYLPKAWHQGFILSPFGDTFYGLKQIQGGPCGIIAAVQCFFLKHLMYMSKPTCESDLKNQTRRQNCLIAALTDILWKTKGSNNDKITLIIPTNRNFTGPKLQFTSLTEVEIQAQTFQSAYESMWNYKSSFIGQANHGVTVIIYSIIMTKGIEKIYEEVDMKENPLIGHHGHCTQELVNLFITGQATSNCFDGKKQLQDNFTLHGINQKSQFGFLTVFQFLNYIQVGKNLKNPIFPIWVISKQFHYHVVFGNHYLISENNDCSKFDLIYFDGLYACDKFIRLTFDQLEKDQFGMVKEDGDVKNLPLIQQVLLKKWGRRKVDWNGSTKIL